jgi:NAD(P)-dependent dehydrogenase (short-subunit alcohol dehydrogenase family)
MSDPQQSLIVGASQGIGLALVRQLLSQRNTVHATYRNPDAELLTLDHPRLRCWSMDITDENTIAETIANIQLETPVLHRVVNCAGMLHNATMQPEKSLRQLNADQMTRYFQVNSIGAALLAKQVLPLLKHGERAVFATVSAKVGSIGDNELGGWYGYRASKAALNMLMRTAAIEYKRSSPRTILALLHPGTTDTPLSAPFQRNVPPEKLFSPDRTAGLLLSVMDGLQESDSGGFFSWDGSRLPW